jgi:dGTPase
MADTLRMDWRRLVSSARLGQKNYQPEFTEWRSEFQRDYDRLIFSSPFRRLQNKTQVFPLPGSVFVHNRLTHSLEVSSVGRSLGNDAARELLKLHPDLSDAPLDNLGLIVSAACLAHDLGNPPFGHSGERAIASFFSEGKGRDIYAWLRKEEDAATAEQLWNDIVHFDGNANAFRLLTHQYEGRREGGFAMTYSVLASVVKYPYSSMLAGKKSKFGFFCSERDYFRTIATHLGMICRQDEGGKLSYARYPLVYFVEAADDICYEIMDIEDAHKLHILTYDQTSQLLLNFFDPERQAYLRNAHPNVTDPNERIIYLRSCVINQLEQECVRAFIGCEDEIMTGLFQGSLIDRVSEPSRSAFRACADFARKHIYKAREVLDVELAGYRIIYMLLDLMTDAVLEPDKAYSRLLLDRVPEQYQIRHPRLGGRLMGMLDYISGMTDVYALDLYRKITGQSLPVV